MRFPPMRVLGLVTFLAATASACTPSLVQIEADNERALARANARIATTGAPFSPPGVDVQMSVSDSNYRSPDGEAATPVANTGSHGLRDGEYVAKLHSTGELVLVGGFCAWSDSCGRCSRKADYFYFHTPDGAVVVVRRRPVVEEVATHDDNTCSAHCSGGNPEARTSSTAIPGARLGISAIDRLELRDEPYALRTITRVCTNTEPVP